MEILDQFGIQPLLLAAQAVNFIVLLLLLKKFLYKPILEVLDERKRRVEKSLNDALEIEKNLLKTEEGREAALDKASEESKKIVDEATKSAQEIINEARLKAQQDIDLLLTQARSSIESEREKMQNELRGEFANIVSAALTKVTGKALTPTDQKKLVEGSIKIYSDKVT